MSPQTFQCDWPGDAHPAVWAVTSLSSGDVAAWCDAHYLELMTSTVNAVAEAEAAQTAADVEARLAAAPPAAPDPATAKVVRRGTSRSRQAYEARQRDRDAGQAPEYPADIAADPEGAEMAPADDPGSVDATA